LKLIRF